jgi:dihydrofolate synthase / folylpolyglutamate synthase
MSDAYQASLDFLYSRLNYERVGMPRTPDELRLGRMRRLLRLLDDPHEALRIVHVAGTKGKGSSAALIAGALTASGYKTGLFCSPHLHRLEERFAIDGQTPSPDELVALTDAVRPAVATLDAETPAYRRGPTFFEITTAMGLLHFAQRRTGAVVLEVGMGGRLDSTNAVRPELAVITTISFDHTRQLGNTLGAIATEKAGILKRGRPAVSGVRGDEPRGAIEQIARARDVLLHQVDADFEYDYIPPEPPLSRPSAGAVAVRTWRTDWGVQPLPLLGAHQALNAAVALASLDALADRGWAIEPAAVSRGWSHLTWPARVEVLGEQPWLVIDGAHNVASAEALADTLSTCFPHSRRTLVFGTTKEKDLLGQLRALLPLFDQVIATRYVENPRAVEPEMIVRAVEYLEGPPAWLTSEPAEALAAAKRFTEPDGLICVTGSLFLAAEARALLIGAEVPAIAKSVAC